MAEELQELIERIHKEGVEKAEAQAQDILSRAEAKAKKIVSEAENAAEQRKQQAEKEVERMTKSGEQALRQAGRDVIISIGKGLETILQRAVAEDAGRVLTAEELHGLLGELLQNLADHDKSMSHLALTLNQDDLDRLTSHDAGVLAEKLKQGVTLRADPTIRKGFRISYVDEHLHHDFSDASIAEVLASLLHPRLARLVKEAVQDSGLSSSTPEKGQA